MVNYCVCTGCTNTNLSGTREKQAFWMQNYYLIADYYYLLLLKSSVSLHISLIRETELTQMHLAAYMSCQQLQILLRRLWNLVLAAPNNQECSSYISAVKCLGVS